MNIKESEKLVVVTFTPNQRESRYLKKKASTIYN